MSREQLQKYASRTSKTLDTQYNRGRKDCIDGNIFSIDAKYFMLVENIKLTNYYETANQVCYKES